MQLSSSKSPDSKNKRGPISTLTNQQLNLKVIHDVMKIVKLMQKFKNKPYPKRPCTYYQRGDIYPTLISKFHPQFTSTNINRLITSNKHLPSSNHQKTKKKKRGLISTNKSNKLKSSTKNPPFLFTKNVIRLHENKNQKKISKFSCCSSIFSKKKHKNQFKIKSNPMTETKRSMNQKPATVTGESSSLAWIWSGFRPTRPS